jgi:putative ABC transport system permease protein
MIPARPPRLARRLLERTLPPDVRDAIAGDLAEVFARDCRADGAARARLRYWRKAMSFSAHFTLDRLRERRPRFSRMDLKLGFRMLIKYPGLTMVGGLAMAFAIAIGAAAFEFVNQVVSPSLPLHDGQRIVGIRLWHTATHGVEEQALWDYTTWQGRLETIDNLGVFRTVERNLIGGDAHGAPIMTAEITASAFALTRVPALLGRTLIESDEQPGAQPVVVIGHDVWQSRFAADTGVVGRTVQVGEVPRTVVGVMPEGFGFPRFHSMWVPLRLSDLQFGRRQGPWVYVFGRLAPRISFAEAQAELAALGRRASAEFPDTHEHIRPEVLPYAEVVSPDPEIGPYVLRAINVFFVMLVVLVCANVALLMFARAATRQSELVVRTALGASRGRIAGQLFAEALALGSVSLVIGLWAAGFALRWWLGVARAEDHGRLPFWYSDSLSLTTFIYAALLTVLGAAIAGIVPALKATGRGLETRLRQSSAGGGGLRFGGVWTVVIVTQVALTVAFPSAAFFIRQTVMQVRAVDAGFSAERYLSANVEMDPEFVRGKDGVTRAEFPAARFRAASEELARRLSAEPGVAGVTFADRIPRTYHPPRRIEVDVKVDINASAIGAQRAGAARVSVDYFDVLGAPVRTGRAFTTGDLDPQTRTVIVNASFVRDVLSGRHAIGLRMRELSSDPDDDVPGPWLEIVGVAPDLGMIGSDLTQTAGYYRPAAPGSVQPSHVVVHVRGDTASVAARMHAIAAAVDPALRLHSVARISDGDPTEWLEFDFLFKLLALVSSIALLLSLAGIYAAMSLAVSRRTREIGIRVALGANVARVASATFGRTVAHVGLGVVLGAGLTGALAWTVTGGLSVSGAFLVAGYAALMLAVCLLSSITPLRRALRIDPTEALRAEA